MHNRLIWRVGHEQDESCKNCRTRVAGVVRTCRETDVDQECRFLLLDFLATNCSKTTSTLLVYYCRECILLVIAYCL
jgi:hypothetical protein